MHLYMYWLIISTQLVNFVPASYHIYYAMDISLHPYLKTLRTPVSISSLISCCISLLPNYPLNHTHFPLPLIYLLKQHFPLLKNMSNINAWKLDKDPPPPHNTDLTWFLFSPMFPNTFVNAFYIPSFLWNYFNIFLGGFRGQII